MSFSKPVVQPSRLGETHPRRKTETPQAGYLNVRSDEKRKIFIFPYKIPGGVYLVTQAKLKKPMFDVVDELHRVRKKNSGASSAEIK